MLRVSRLIVLMFLTGLSLSEARFRASSSSSSSEPANQKDKVPLGKRIETGYRSGALTQKEYDELKAQQKEMREFRDKAKKDGEMTAEERAQLREMRDELRKNLGQELNDKQLRPQLMLDSFARRIQSGIRSGTLTPAEVAQLNKVVEEAKAYYEKALKDDGKIDAEEREGLGVLMNSVRVDIGKEMYDTQMTKLAPDDCGALTPEQCDEWRKLRDKRRARAAGSP